MLALGMGDVWDSGINATWSSVDLVQNAFIGNRRMVQNYTTRTAIETSSECERRGYFFRFHSGHGITPITEYIPFVFGQAVHLGTECIDRGDTVDVAVIKARHHFTKKAEGKGLVDLQGRCLDYETEHIIKEQLALVEALVRAWYIAEWPKLKRFFEIKTIEKEYQMNLLRDGSIVLVSKPDRLLKDKERGDLYIYSIKTMKQWYERSEKAYRVDLQGITEAIAVSIVEKMKVMATKFCFLIKGKQYKRVETKLEDGILREHEFKTTENPFIYAYKKVDEETGKVRYAHSNKTVKPENVSGFGRLGKGWEKFKVWETKGGVRQWMEILRSGKIQPELGDILKTHVVTPVEVHRTKSQLQSRLIQIQSQEAARFLARDKVRNGESLDLHFPFNTRSCYFPDFCPYLPICPNGNDDYKPDVAEDPIGSGWYEEREPHYEIERKAIG